MSVTALGARLRSLAIVGGLLVAASTTGAWAQPAEPRTVYVISDLHMGLGRLDDGSWHRNEDFRWPNALAAFLDQISSEERDAIDLVVAGDFLELWEASDGKCAGPPEAPDDAELGCTIPEMVEVADAILTAHAAEIDALGRFAAKGTNTLHIVGGNHDAALMLDAVWAPVAAALGARGGRVTRPAAGYWLSDDGRVLVEHGHQVPYDPNGYDDWPSITQTENGVEYILRPWGERFVQKLFTQEERDFPLIDNLSPHSAGLRYRIAERGVTGTAVDLARFVKFNLLETSLYQKLDILEEAEGPPVWDEAAARAMGHRLMLGALAQDDPLRATIGSDDPEWVEVRTQLDAMVADPEQLPLEEVKALCDQLAVRDADEKCTNTLGAAFAGLVFSRQELPAELVKERWDAHRGMRTWVYGHTHSFELPWETQASSSAPVRVANSGAFQRVIDDDRLRALAESAGKEPGEMLREGNYSELPACYTAVRVKKRASGLEREVRAWHMPELGVGTFVDPCSPLCATVGHGCEAQ